MIGNFGFVFEERSHDERLRSTLKRDTGCVFNFENLRCRDGLVRTIGLTVEIKLLRRCMDSVLDSF